MHTTGAEAEQPPLLTRTPFAWGTLIGSGEDGAPLYRRISDAIRAAVVAGRLRPGTRLPSERALAKQLGVSRSTIVTAFDDLASYGVIRRQVGRGSFICACEASPDAPFAWEGKLSARSPAATRGGLARLAEPHRQLSKDAGRSIISFSRALPAIDVFPREELRELMDAALSRNPASLLGAGSIYGQAALREGIAARMGVPVERVLIVSGAREAFHLIGRCLTDPKDAVVADDPGSVAFRRALQGVGCTLLRWSAPSWDIDRLEDTILRYQPRLIFANPLFHDPTTRSMSRNGMHDLVELAARYRVPVIEDVAFLKLAFRGTSLPTLGRLAPDAVVQVGTLSTTLGPGPRLGFVIASPVLLQQLAFEKERISSFSSAPSQAVAGEMMRSGLYETHLQRLRQEHAARLKVLLSSIQRRLSPRDLRFSVPEGGLFLWVRLARALSAETLRRFAQEAGVDFTTGAELSHRSDDLPFLRFCFASVPVAEIDEGVRRLALAIERMTSSEVIAEAPVARSA